MKAEKIADHMVYIYIILFIPFGYTFVSRKTKNTNKYI